MKTILIILCAMLTAYAIYQGKDMRERESKIRTVADASLELKRESQLEKAKTKDLISKNAELSNQVAQLKAELLKMEAKLNSIADTTYVVLNRVYTPGKLSQVVLPVQYQNTAVLNTESQRSDPKWELYLEGVQSGRKYPPILVTQGSYSHFIEGSICSRIDLLNAKMQ